MRNEFEHKIGSLKEKKNNYNLENRNLSNVVKQQENIISKIINQQKI